MKPITDKRKYNKYINEIIKEIKESYEGTLDLCGEDDELTIEAKGLYKKVITHPVEDCEKDIEEFFQELYECVNGNIEYYYADCELLLHLFKDLAYSENE